MASLSRKAVLADEECSQKPLCSLLILGLSVCFSGSIITFSRTLHSSAVTVIRL